eukprot:1419567-Rhodomonas_salina.1
MDKVDPCWDQHCKAVDHCAKLDTRLAKFCRLRDWLKDLLGDAVSVVDTDLQKYSSIILGRARMRRLSGKWTWAYTAFMAEKHHPDHMEEYERRALNAKRYFFELVLSCKEYAEWLLTTMPHDLTPEAEKSINDVIKSYETLHSQVSAEVLSVEDNHSKDVEYIGDLDNGNANDLLLWP